MVLKSAVLIGALLLLVVFAGWFVFTANSGDGLSMVGESSSADTPAPVGARRTGGDAVDERDDDMWPSDEEEEEEKIVPFRFLGGVTVVEESGVRDESPSGTMTLEYYPLNEDETVVRVPVRDGAFDVVLPSSDGNFEVFELTFEGRRCYLQPDGMVGSGIEAENGNPVTLTVVPWPRLSLRGRVRVVGPGGVVDERPNGSFQICGEVEDAPNSWHEVRFSQYSDDDDTRLAEVEVVGGHFECEVPARLDYYNLRAAKFAGHDAILEDFDARDPQAVVLTFLRRTPPILDVRDRPTGEPLAEVLILETPHGRSPVDPDIRAESRVVVADTPSPVTLPIPEESWGLWVGAAGHDWKEVHVGPTEVEPVLVALEPAGVVELRVVGELREDLLVSLMTTRRSLDFHTLMSRPVDFRTRRFVVPVGRHRLVVWSRDRSFKHYDVTLEVTAGEPTVYVIDLDAIPEYPPLVRLRGRLIIPEAWGLGPSLEFDAINETLTRPQRTVRLYKDDFHDVGGGVYEFEVELAAGSYIVRKLGSAHSWAIDVANETNAVIELRLPRPAKVIVTLKHEWLEEGSDLGTYWLNCEGWNGRRGAIMIQKIRHLPDGRKELTCPFGPALLWIRGGEFAPQRRLIDIRSTPHHETIVLEPALGVLVDVTRDGEPWPEVWKEVELDYVLEFLDSKPRRPDEMPESARSLALTPAKRSVAYPGRYRLRVTTLPPGCRAVPDIDLRIEPGSYTRVTLALESR